MKWYYCALVIAFIVLGIWTLFPAPDASKLCLIGYYAHCSFTPLGTGICTHPQFPLGISGEFHQKRWVFWFSFCSRANLVCFETQRALLTVEL